MNLSDLKVFVIGPNVWGKGDTIDEAVKNAGKPKQWVAYIAHNDTKVDPIDGGMSFPSGERPGQYQPKRIHGKGVKLS